MPSLFLHREKGNANKFIENVLWYIIPVGSNFEWRRLKVSLFAAYIVSSLGFCLRVSYYDLTYAADTKHVLLATERCSMLATVVYSALGLSLRRTHFLRIKTEFLILENIFRTNGIDFQWEVGFIHKNIIVLSALFSWFVLTNSSQVVSRILYTYSNIVLILMIMNGFVEFLRLLSRFCDAVMHADDPETVVLAVDSVYAISDDLMTCYGSIVFIILSSMFSRVLCNLYIQFTSPFDIDNNLWLFIGAYPIVYIITNAAHTLTKVSMDFALQVVDST